MSPGVADMSFVLATFEDDVLAVEFLPRDNGPKYSSVMSEQQLPTLPADLLTTGQAANLIHCNPATIWRWCLRGKVPSWRRGRQLLVSRADVLACVQRVESTKPAPESGAQKAAVDVWADAGVKRWGLW